MEVKAGYKKTDVGPIPKDWSCVALATIAKVQGGKRLPSGYVLVDEHTGHPYIRVSDMKMGGIEEAAIKHVPKDAFPAISRYRIYTSDIFISVAGTLGIVGIIPPALDGANLTENADRITSIQCDQHYLMYWLLSSQIQNIIKSIMTVGAQPKLALGRIAEFRIALPDTLLEQQAIANALSDIDELVASLDQLIAKKRDLKQAAMQQLLTGTTRLQGFNGEWETKRLGELSQLYQPKTIGQSVFTTDGYPVYGANGIIGRYSKYNHMTRQITISCRGNCGTVNKTEQLAWITGNAMVVNFDANKSIDWDFAYQLLLFQDFSVLVTGSGQPQIVRGPLSEFLITLPRDINEQKAIAEVLSDMDTELTELEQRRDKTIALKQGMMQELLTGRTRLV